MRPSCILTLVLPILTAAIVDGGECPVPGYSDYNEFRLELESIAASKYASLESLGSTLSKRDVYLLRVGTGKTDEKPAVLVIGGMDSSRLSGSTVATGLAARLVREAEKKPAVREMLERVTFYFIPRAAPDTCEAFFRRPFSARIRNDRPIDEDGDGKIDEDGPDDLDGDGWITWMRIRDPAGEYTCDPDDDRIMVKAEAKKRDVKRYRVLREGRDNDKDTKIDEDPPGGTAFNRNFTFDYAFFGEGAGPNQISEPETRAVAEFAFAHENVFLVWVFSDDDNLLRFWKVDAGAEKQRVRTTLQADDLPDYEALAEAFKRCVTRRDPPPTSNERGTVEKWAYFHFGRPTIVSRPWWPVSEKREPGKPEKDADEKTNTEDESTKEDPDKEGREKEKRPAEKKSVSPDAVALECFERHKIDGFVEWKRYNHPDFPSREVEIGGFRPFLRENPPACELKEVTDQAFAFLTELEGLFPRLVLETTKTEHLGAGLVRVTARVRNEGPTATMSRMGEINGRPIGVQVRLSADTSEVEFIDGPARRMIGRLAAGAEKELTWMIRLPKKAAEELRLRAWAPSVGEVQCKISLVK